MMDVESEIYEEYLKDAKETKYTIKKLIFYKTVDECYITGYFPINQYFYVFKNRDRWILRLCNDVIDSFNSKEEAMERAQKEFEEIAKEFLEEEKI